MNAVIFALFFLAHLGNSATIGPNPEINKPSQENYEQSEGDPKPLEEMNVTPAAPLKKQAHQNFFYPFLKEFVGYLGPTYRPAGNDFSFSDIRIGIGGAYVWPGPSTRRVETGFLFSSSNEGYAWVGFRKISNSTDPFRTYFSISPGVTLNPNYGLATFIRWQNFFVKGAFGIEKSFNSAMSYVAEIYALEDALFFPGFGVMIGGSLGLD